MEKAAWKSLKIPLPIFLEIKRRITIVLMVADLVKYHKVMGCICI